MTRRRALGVPPTVFACSLALAIGWPAASVATSPGAVVSVAEPTRVIGRNVYGSAVAAARSGYPEWDGVRHVVVASGEPGALTDPIVASSLCWAYDAPLLLVTKKSLPAETRDALASIVSANESVTVHVVGSSRAVSAGCVEQIRSAVGTAPVEQPWPTADRYSLAAAVAARVRDLAAEQGSDVPTVALVARGSDSASLWDAAAASAVARHTGMPVLLTRAKSVPAVTASAIASAGPVRVVVVGGTSAVSPSVYARLGASERWGGTTRYDAAVSVAIHAASSGYSDVSTFGIAATVPNAVVGASMIGARGGVLLYSGRDRVHKTTWGFLSSRASELASAYAFGGSSIAGSQVAELGGAASKPWFATGAPGRWVGKRFKVAGHVGGNTTTVTLYVHGKKVRTATVKPWGTFRFDSVSTPVTNARVSVIANNDVGPGTKTSRQVSRLRYPSPTCIVIDKSAFRLYWVKNNRLVKSYPIAIGKVGWSTPAPATWKILKKYRTSPGSVYGPRKMRLFRKRGGRFVFTAYGIHGTNQEWVIGTRASHGCIRMYNRHVLELFPQVPMGTMVYTRP